MKKEDILKAANDIVAEYMANGYLICRMNCPFGYEFRVDLENDYECIRVKVEKFSHMMKNPYVQYEGLELSVVNIGYADAFEDNTREPLYIKRFYFAN